jgi:CRISPR type III-B/RAMP module RAMP protein Cmr6
MRYSSRRPSEPKPFAYVDILRDIQKSKYVADDRFYEEKLTGRLELELQVISDYLFVGSGNYDLSEKDKLVYYSFFRTNGKIVIPGTSIKGAVRSVLEAISNSCVSQAGRRENYPHTHKKCEFKPEKEKVDLCRACKVFGTTGYAGRVNFSDALPETSNIEIEKIHELFPPKKNKGTRKFYQNKKFNPVGNRRPEQNYRFVEAVKKGSIFKTSLSFQNLTKEELGLLCYAMGVGQDYMIKVGGAKPRCFGTVRFIPINLKLWTDPLEKAEEQSGDGLRNFISDVLACDNLVVPELLNQFRDKISKPDESCPKGAY